MWCSGALLVVVLAVWVRGILGLLRRRRRSRHWLRAQAHVVERRSWRPGLRRVAFALPDGRQVTGRLAVETLPGPGLAVGDDVPIAYDPDDVTRRIVVLSQSDLVVRLVAETIAVAGAAALFSGVRL